jgi:hypothetical protein
MNRGNRVRKILLLLVSLALALAACASVNGLRASSPIATLTTTKQPSAVAQCIRDAWQSQRIGIEANGAELQVSAGTYTVVSPVGGVPQEIADVTSDGKVSVYAQKSIDLGGREKRRVSAATSCI